MQFEIVIIFTASFRHFNNSSVWNKETDTQKIFIFGQFKLVKNFVCAKGCILLNAQTLTTVNFLLKLWTLNFEFFLSMRTCDFVQIASYSEDFQLLIDKKEHSQFVSNERISVLWLDFGSQRWNKSLLQYTVYNIHLLYSNKCILMTCGIQAIYDDFIFSKIISK